MAQSLHILVYEDPLLIYLLVSVPFFFGPKVIQRNEKAKKLEETNFLLQLFFSGGEGRHWMKMMKIAEEKSCVFISCFFWGWN